MFVKKESFNVLQSLKLKDKDSTNLLLFLNEQKHRYKTNNNNNGGNTPMIESLFSLLNRVASLAIQFSIPVSKAQLTHSKIINSKASLKNEINSFIESIQTNNYHMPLGSSSVSVEPSTSFFNSSYIVKKSDSPKRKQKELTKTQLKNKPKPKQNCKEKKLSVTNTSTPIHNNNKTTHNNNRNKQFIFVNSISKRNRNNKVYTSIHKPPCRNHSEFLFSTISKSSMKNSINSRGLRTDIKPKPSYNASMLFNKNLTVIDKYYSLETEEQEKARSYSGGKSCTAFYQHHHLP